ncbi:MULTISPECIES: AAA family ATPase [unclassified Vibrio]|uniref:AAA family ATPase n=1 Tax=unclassified Vibrio TaxID=2614977 RepID=UPI000C831A8C|nr:MULTISPECIES: AAA family ATPase [unclassified Vibrio]PMI22865.1 ATPase [Vibrio sp. 10N.286.46.E10]PMJ03522.1 ATPase [Vibrio sp. 10N.286.45.E10]PTP07042.1 ATPase [Vibrio sp. 10N.286.45.A3]PTQ24432.1 ATPase [Vibrio sp. 10N.286.46.E10]TKE88523.1 ATPase [Vibrio sp. F12]
MNPIIITGGPGAGKTTLINALGDAGYPTFAESSRQLIEEQSQIENGILPWLDLPGFAELCLGVMSKQKEQARQHPTAFLDRAIPDIGGYLAQAKLDIDATYREASKGYHSQVLFCRPEASIYVQDEVRLYPFEEALEIHHALVNVYQELGYEIVEVPFMSVAERVQFVESHLGIKS